MTFSDEVENEASLAFLDVLVPRNDNKIKPALYRKSTFSSVSTIPIM